MSKFQLVCSCVICKVQITTQGLAIHIRGKHTIKGHRKQCEAPLFTKNTFCNASCSAKYNNVRKDYTTFKPGPKKGSVLSTNHRIKKIFNKNTERVEHVIQPAFTEISQCVVCNKFHPGKGKSCSKPCKSVVLSQSMKNRIYNGFNPNQNRGRGKASYLEKSFEAWLVDKLPQLEFHTEYSFKRFDQVKTYFADFYFPTKRLIIELDGSQHLGKKQKQYDQERDQYITDHYGGISNAD